MPIWSDPDPSLDPDDRDPNWRKPDPKRATWARRVESTVAGSRRAQWTEKGVLTVAVFADLFLQAAGVVPSKTPRTEIKGGNEGNQTSAYADAVAFVVAWAKREGSDGDDNNPLNTMLGGKLRPRPEWKVKNPDSNFPDFVSAVHGIASNAETFRGARYTGVRAALAAGNLRSANDALYHSGWCFEADNRTPCATYRTIASDVERWKAQTPARSAAGLDWSEWDNAAGRVVGFATPEAAANWQSEIGVAVPGIGPVTLDPLAALGDILEALTSGAFWKRVGLGALGVTFVAAGATVVGRENMR